MRQTIKIFHIGLKQIARDGMLLVLLPAPVLVGLLIRFAAPFVDGVLTDALSFSLRPWYGLIDGMLICLTPMFVAMISAFLLLEERDEGIGAFYQITPAGGAAYASARIGIPMLWAFAATIAVAGFLNISGLQAPVLWAGSLIGALMGVALSLMVVSLADNRVEGIALSKLMGASFLGLVLVWFVPAPQVYLCAFLPSFWIGRIILDGATIFTFGAGMLTCLLWIGLLLRRRIF